MANAFITGATGYVGGALVPALVARGHRVRALVRAESVRRTPAEAVPVIGDALDGDSFASALDPETTLIHLVGTPHPNPSKALQFERVDLASIRASVRLSARPETAEPREFD